MRTVKRDQKSEAWGGGASREWGRLPLIWVLSTVRVVAVSVVLCCSVSVTHSQPRSEYYVENSRNKQLASLKFHTAAWRHLVCLTVVHPSCKWLLCIHALYPSCALLCSCRQYTLALFMLKETLLYLIMVPATIEMTLAVLFQHTVRGAFIYYLFIFTVLGMLHNYSYHWVTHPSPFYFFIIVNFLLYLTYQFNFIMIIDLEKNRSCSGFGPGVGSLLLPEDRTQVLRLGNK